MDDPADSTVALPPRPDPPGLDRVGDYRILREIGRGGMGVVYEAEQVSLGRRVALKILPRESALDAVLLERFRREARAAAQLHHTNIVPVFEVGQEGDTCFYAMQFIQGQPLDQVFQDLQRQRSRDYRHVARLGLQVAEGLGYAHARGILHRDVKPSNLLLDAQGVVWISDFGLARTQERALTETGDIVGTLRYMAPERFRGQCDARADLYALGLTLYELLTLRPAFSPDGRRILGVGGKPGELVLVTWDARE